MSIQMTLEQAMKQFNDDMGRAQTVTDDALKELMAISHQEKVAQRYARLYVYRLQKTLAQFNTNSTALVSADRENNPNVR